MKIDGLNVDDKGQDKLVGGEEESNESCMTKIKLSVSDVSLFDNDCNELEVGNEYKLLEFENCYVNYDGVVFNGKNQVLKSSLYLLSGVNNGRLNYKKEDNSCSVIYENIIELDSIIVINSPGVKNYFHFYYDFLSKLLFFKKSKLIEKYSIIAPVVDRPFQKNLLKLTDVIYTRLDMQENEVVKAKRILYLNYANNHRSFLGDLAKNLRKELLLSIGNSTSDDFIYISRVGEAAKNRKILNEDSIQKILEDKGFKIIHPQKLSVLEQAEVFSKAKLIISPSGAANTNLIFCKEGTNFMELNPLSHHCNPKSFIYNFWKDYALSFNLKYTCFHIDMAIDLESYQRSSYKVDLYSFEESVNKLILSIKG